MITDLNASPLVLPAADSETYDWSEVAHMWDSNDFPGVHDWLNARWSCLLQTRLLGHEDPDARFLQGFAFAALALHFTQVGNQEGALLMLDDALVVLSTYRPSHLGVRVQPILDSLLELRPLLAGLAPEAECPMQPFVYRKFEYRS